MMTTMNRIATFNGTGVSGRFDPRFSRVVDAFIENFTQHEELGASAAVFVRGKPVVDVWGGFADAARTRQWEENTLVCGLSLSKALSAEALHVLVDQGKARYDDLVVKYWPEYGQHGKGSTTLRHVLSHQAAVFGISKPLGELGVCNWDNVIHALEEQKPFWEPGVGHGYHVGTYGFLVGELVQRITGERFDAFYRDNVAGPIGLDIIFGVSDADMARVAEYSVSHPLKLPEETEEQRELTFAAYTNGTIGGMTANTVGTGIMCNDDRFKRSINPTNGAHLNGRSMARFGAMRAARGMIDGTRLLSSEIVDESIVSQSAGTDRLLGVFTSFAMGFDRWGGHRSVGPNPDGSYWTTGFGGAFCLVDPDYELAFGYAMNSPGPRHKWLSVRNVPLMEAAYAALES